VALWLPGKTDEKTPNLNQTRSSSPERAQRCSGDSEFTVMRCRNCAELVPAYSYSGNLSPGDGPPLVAGFAFEFDFFDQLFDAAVGLDDTGYRFDCFDGVLVAKAEIDVEFNFGVLGR